MRQISQPSMMMSSEHDPVLSSLQIPVRLAKGRTPRACALNACEHAVSAVLANAPAGRGIPMPKRFRVALLRKAKIRNLKVMRRKHDKVSRRCLQRRQ
jgi:hypothetical protein